MENSSTKVSLTSHSSLVKDIADHQPVDIFTKEILDPDKPILVENLPPFKLAGVPTNQARTGNILGDWDPYISSAVVIFVDISV